MSVEPTKPTPILPPGTYIEEWLEDEEIKQQELAERLNTSTKHLSQVINGHKPITPNFAAKLALVTGYPEEFWLVHQAKYDARRATLNVTDEDVARIKETLNSSCISRLRSSGIIRSTWQRPLNVVHDLLAHLRIANPSMLLKAISAPGATASIAYRQSSAFDTKQPELWTWLEVVKFKALQQINLPEFSHENLEKSIPKLKQISIMPPDDFIEQVTRILNAHGVAFVAESDIPGARISGATFMQGDTPVIAVSDKQKREDVFWFTLFHEIAHVVLGDIENIHLDFTLEDYPSEAEIRANEWASQRLIPHEIDFGARDVSFPSASVIKALAKQNQVSEGIIVGRIQHLTKDYSRGTAQIRRFEIHN